MSKTQEGSLADYAPGALVEFESVQGAKGLEAHHARLLSPEEADDLGLVSELATNSDSAVEVVAERVTGTATKPIGDHGFTFVQTAEHGNVFLHGSSLNSQESLVFGGTELMFDIVRTAKGLQAREAAVISQPQLRTLKDDVEEWPWDYGFLRNCGFVRSDVLRNLGYLRAGDRVEVTVAKGDNTAGDDITVVGVSRVGWEKDSLSPYERDLDMGDPRRWLPTLAQIAVDERWDVDGRPEARILRSYFKYTYLRQEELGHTLHSGGRMCWNTGLVDVNGDDIVAVFVAAPEEEVGPRWRWSQFTSVTAPSATPWKDAPRASWWEDPADLIYDIQKGVPTVQSEHIAGDRDDRFPENMRGYSQEDLVRSVQEAAKHAVKRVGQNYKTAIPQFYRPRGGKGKGSIQLLLPLRFPGQDRPSLALAVRRDRDGSYYGATVLRMEWAYTYARLITKPDTDWLDPFASAAAAGKS